MQLPVLQIYRVLADLQPGNRERVVDWARGKKRKPTWADVDVNSQLYDIFPKTYRLSHRVMTALQGFLQARSYSTTHVHSKQNRIHISLAQVQALQFKVYASWRSFSDDGRQTYRTRQTRRTGAKDASWALVRFSVDAVSVMILSVMILTSLRCVFGIIDSTTKRTIGTNGVMPVSQNFKE